MDNLTKRILLFLVGCIGLRSLFVLFAYNASPQWLKIAGYLTLLPAIGFAYIFATGTRKTGAETFGAPIWWNMLRPVHSLLYFAFAWNAIQGSTTSWIYLLIDVVIGFLAFLWKHGIYSVFSFV